MSSDLLLLGYALRSTFPHVFPIVKSELTGADVKTAEYGDIIYGSLLNIRVLSNSISSFVPA
jgi:hypothetical protein